MAATSAQNRASMAQAAQKIDHAASTIRGIQTRLDSHRTDLMHGWKGDASAAFNGVFNTFDQKFREVLRELEGMHEKLVHTRIKYETNEQQQTDAVNKINALINGTT